MISPPASRCLRDLAAPPLVELATARHDDRGLVNPRWGTGCCWIVMPAPIHAGLERAYAAWARPRRNWPKRARRSSRPKADQDLLIAHLAELSALEPVAGEEARLAATRADMQKGERLAGELETLRHIWEGSDSPLAPCGLPRASWTGSHPNTRCWPRALAALDRAVIEAGEGRGQAAKRPPRRCCTNLPRSMLPKPACSNCATARPQAPLRCGWSPELMRTMRSRLDAIEGGRRSLDAWEAAARETRSAYVAAAEKAHGVRVAGATRLDKAVAAELAPLKLDGRTVPDAGDEAARRPLEPRTAWMRWNS